MMTMMRMVMMTTTMTMMAMAMMHDDDNQTLVIGYAASVADVMFPTSSWLPVVNSSLHDWISRNLTMPS